MRSEFKWIVILTVIGEGMDQSELLVLGKGKLSWNATCDWVRNGPLRRLLVLGKGKPFQLY